LGDSKKGYSKILSDSFLKENLFDCSKETMVRNPANAKREFTSLAKKKFARGLDQILPETYGPNGNAGIVRYYNNNVNEIGAVKGKDIEQ
jgi:hypothetical protein